ncbi:hypothetical protein P7K49_032682 [Saguinus oedipus]|uniref:Basigin n=1 Tax=Saguinus oedipus TaxID=9490 RepID=A0ABQ9TQH6_SAGOE|nr:hypothetical protein P7K49_032682 [Saguinus oedipus]
MAGASLALPGPAGDQGLCYGSALLFHRTLGPGRRPAEPVRGSPACCACRVDPDDRWGEYSCVFLPEPTGRANIPLQGESAARAAGHLRLSTAWRSWRGTASPVGPTVPGSSLTPLSGPPRVKAVKSSEHLNEGETAVLVCESKSAPPVTDWVWYRITDAGDQVIVNGSQSRFFVNSSRGRSELHIKNLNMEADPGKYACNGTSSEGTDQAVITLRVRSHLAALWPFLGIVAEVLVLVTIIFIYEKRRKPDDVLDGEAEPPPTRPALGATPAQSLEFHC